MINKRLSLVLFFVSAIVAAPSVEAAESGCNQTLVDGTPTLTRDRYISPTQGVVSSYPQGVVPFYQWENDNGYCGEVSMIQAGLNSGQWMSQFNARLVCGTGLSQSGPNGWCKDHKHLPNYNAQLLIEKPDTGVSGPHSYANATTCLANSRLLGATYPYSTGFISANSGIAGYQDFMSWVKSEVIAGHQVTIAVLVNSGADPQYDHEVTVTAIGTNHGTTEPTYYDDDVLYFDDHGSYPLVGGNLVNKYPAIPYGAGADNSGCTPYVFGYTFSSLAQTRTGANAPSAQAYSIIIPGLYPTNTPTGGDGYLSTTPITGHNYGFSVSGAQDTSVAATASFTTASPYITMTANPGWARPGMNVYDVTNGFQIGTVRTYIGTALVLTSNAAHASSGSQDSLFFSARRELRPIQLSIPSETYTNNLANPHDPIAGWQYENSMIGKRLNGMECTNTPPEYWMVPLTLKVTVSELTAGNRYNLYEYDLSGFNGSPTGSAAALQVPTGNFNANASMANHRTQFKATGTTYSQTVTRTSDQIIVFRAVPVSAP
jgi:hypothetical protein